MHPRVRLCLLGIFSLATTLSAQTTWDGSTVGVGTWDTAADWSDDAVPNSLDDVQLDGDAPDELAFNGRSAAYTTNDLTLLKDITLDLNSGVTEDPDTLELTAFTTIVNIRGDLITGMNTLTIKGQGFVRVAGALGTYDFGAADGTTYTYARNLSAFAEADLVLTGNAAVLGSNVNQTLANGGFLDFANGLNLQDKTLSLNSGSGTILGAITAGVNSVVNVTGSGVKNLTLGGDSANAGNSGFSTIGRVNVGDVDKTLILGDNTSDSVDLGYLTTLAGGTLDAYQVELGANDVLSGSGTVDARVYSTSSTSNITLTGNLTVGDGSGSGFNYAGVTEIGSHTLQVADSDNAQLGVTTTLAGGHLENTSGGGFQLSNGDTLSGYGQITGNVTGNAGSIVNANTSGQTLTFNDDASLSGDLIVATGATVNFLGLTTLNGTTTVGSSGNITSASGVSLNGSGVLNISGSTTISSAISGNNGSSVVLTGTATTVNFSSNFSGAVDLGVGFNTANLASSGTDTVDAISINGGTINKTGGTLVVDSITGSGTVNSRLQSTDSGSSITATGSLSIGYAANDAIDWEGTITVGGNDVTLVQNNAVDLKGTTTIAGGDLIAVNGIDINSGGVLSGNGTVTGDVVNSGTVNGTGGGLTFNDSVSGSGDFDGRVNIAGSIDMQSNETFNADQLVLTATAQTNLEIGDSSTYSVVQEMTGTSGSSLTFGGILNITIDDYGTFLTDLQLNESVTYTLFDFDAFSGTFASINIQNTPGITWDTSNLYTLGSITATIPEPATAASLGGLLALGVVWWFRRRR